MHPHLIIFDVIVYIVYWKLSISNEIQQLCLQARRLESRVGPTVLEGPGHLVGEVGHLLLQVLRLDPHLVPPGGHKEHHRLG